MKDGFNEGVSTESGSVDAINDQRVHDLVGVIASQWSPEMTVKIWNSKEIEKAVAGMLENPNQIMELEAAIYNLTGNEEAACCHALGIQSHLQVNRLYGTPLPAPKR